MTIKPKPLQKFLDQYASKHSIIGRIARGEVMSNSKLNAAIKRASFVLASNAFDSEMHLALLAEYNHRRELATRQEQKQ